MSSSSGQRQNEKCFHFFLLVVKASTLYKNTGTGFQIIKTDPEKDPDVLERLTVLVVPLRRIRY